MKEFNIFEWAEENERLAQRAFERFKEEYKLEDNPILTQKSEE